MTSLFETDTILLITFFLLFIAVGLYAARRQEKGAAGYILSGRKVGLLLFILTNTATWYGGILGVGEFSYRYGIASWFTQGLPYYIFAALFALLLAGKIRKASLLTIPDKLYAVYGRKPALLGALLVFILVSPAPYLLMSGSLAAHFFGLPLWLGLLVVIIPVTVYLAIGGFKANIYTDAFLFIIMFAGFIAVFALLLSNYGGTGFLSGSLPSEMFSFTGGASPVYIAVWFLIALWTFADPGFHQRAYSAKTASVAKKGILISILFWIVFDFLTNSVGLYTRAILPSLDNPVLAFPELADTILPPGYRGFFYAALFATILSTLNSFLFLSGTTLGKDFFHVMSKSPKEEKIKTYSIYGLIISAILAFILSLHMKSVIDIWYIIGSLCIPGLLLPILGGYFSIIRIPSKYALFEMIAAVSAALLWEIGRRNIFQDSSLTIVEPMLPGLAAACIIHLAGMLSRKRKENKLR